MDKIIWLMLLMPTHQGEEVTAFPMKFETKEACESLGQILIVEREFRCIAQTVDSLHRYV